MIVLIHIYSKLCRHFSGRLTLPPNDRGYGHPAVCGSITVAKRNSECGRKTCGMHVSQQVNIDTMIKSKLFYTFFLENPYFCTAQKEDFSRYFVPKMSI